MTIQSKSSSASSDRRGAIVPLVAIMLVAILGLAALSVDAGNLYRERRNTQTAADAAADAAGLELLSKFASFEGVDRDGAARAAALSIAAAHGYQEKDVTVNMPPLSGAFLGKRGYAEVIVTTRPARFFSSIFGNSEQVVRSRAVGAGAMIATNVSVLILDPKAKNSLKLKGKTSTIEVGGDIIVNSNNKRAVQVDKKAQIKAEHVMVTGGLAKNAKRNIDAEVSTGVPPTPDPWDLMPAPAKGSTLNLNDFKTTVDGNEIYNLQPGTYKQLKFDKNDRVNMAPGIYYVDGGSFEVKGNATLNATEVMVYSTGKRGTKISTKGEVVMSPMKSGTYRGITIFQDSTKKTKVEFSKQSHMDISGIVYAPMSEVKFRQSNIDFGDYDEDDDWELEEDVPMEDDYGLSDTSSISAAIVARKLSIDKRTRVILKGADISGLRPLSGIVE